MSGDENYLFCEQLFKAGECYVTFLHKVLCVSVRWKINTFGGKKNIFVSQIWKKLAAVTVASSSMELLSTKFFFLIENKILDEAFKKKIIIHQLH